MKVKFLLPLETCGACPRARRFVVVIIAPVDNQENQMEPAAPAT
jgi:hypothetical protein